MNKYFQDFTNGPRFQDLCQAGVKGLIIAIDRFEPRRKFRLSTYALFWIRHAIIRSMTISSFTRVSFGLESVCSLLHCRTNPYIFFFHLPTGLLCVLYTCTDAPDYHTTQTALYKIELYTSLDNPVLTGDNTWTNPCIRRFFHNCLALYHSLRAFIERLEDFWWFNHCRSGWKFKRWN